MSHQLPLYAELHCISNFTFLRGASHPEELVERVRRLGYSALALTDECSVAGIVKAHQAAKAHGIKLIVGAEFRLVDGPHVVLLARDKEGYGGLCELITRGRGKAEKGNYRLSGEDIAPDRLRGCLALWLPGETPDRNHGRWLRNLFPQCTWILVELFHTADDAGRLKMLTDLGEQLRLPLVAAGDVHMHARSRRALQDTLTAIRLRMPLSQAGFALFPNGERHLRHRRKLAGIYPIHLLEETQTIADRCQFSLDELRYEYPQEWLPPGMSAQQYLHALVQQGIGKRWPQGVSQKTLALIEHELRLIAELRYEAFFLTVYDIVRFARSQGILCQGRGSAANSVVCYCLGITEVDPEHMETLFERFVSKERNEPPDIDVDFEHERREEVIQYIYAKYGRERAALAASVSTYRTRSAVRDIGKALGLSLEQVDGAAKALAWWEGREQLPERLRAVGLEPDNPVIARLIALVNLLVGFPRHLSQHVGGMVMTHGVLNRLVPIENAAMPARTVIQWDKDDLDAVGLLKVDCLALGMLTAIHRAFDLIAQHEGRQLSLAGIPQDDPQVYAMIQRADTIGVFQIESRAQMAMLPRLGPKCFYDLVIQIAIVRPGPIQGNMVHPYLRRRAGLEPVTYPSEAVRATLERTLGVPIFQEQVIKLAMVAAGFSGGEADQLRRAMAAWQRRGGLEHFEQRLINGMRVRGYPEEYARQIFAQIRGFGEYGFPESHAASFALLAYISAWLKHYTPAAFTCALLNSQPMGFYAPVERNGKNALALRLGLRLVKGLSRRGAESLIRARNDSSFASVAELAHRAQLSQRDLKALAAADALISLAGERPHAHWQIQGVEPLFPLLAATSINEGVPLLRSPRLQESVMMDYMQLGFSLRPHPLTFIRKQLQREQIITAAQLWEVTNGRNVQIAGLVISRQRPSSTSGVVFLTLEDETGIANIIVWRDVAERYRRALLSAAVLKVEGKLERQGEVLHVVAQKLEELYVGATLRLPQAPAVRQ